MKFQSRRHEPPAVELTPLIDVVFLLLIFFMLTTTFVTRTSLPIDLPEADSAASSDGRERIEVRVPADGSFRVNGEAVASESALRERLADLRSEHASPVLVIRGDRRARHGVVTQVMDAAQAAGLSRVAVGVQSRTEEAAE